MPARFIVTAAFELQKYAFQELAEIAPDLRKERDLKDGVFLIETDMPPGDFTAAVVRRDPIFVKHLMPVQAEVGLTGQLAVDGPALVEQALRLAPLGAGENFSVQCRHIGRAADYTAKDIEVRVGSQLEARGARPVFSDLQVQAAEDQPVVSIYLFENEGYLGCSTVRENLNEHCDEYRIFSRRPRDVSRAEFKLVEALRKFHLSLPAGRALDLGAAPGGWTKVLADQGLEVVAVDPAALHPKVLQSPRVTHVQAKAETYVSAGDFDLLVNDMNVDPEESAARMVAMAPHLKPGAWAIMTVKLVIRNPEKLLGNIRPILQPAYTLLKVKNLFHNRFEVTLLLRRKMPGEG